MSKRGIKIINYLNTGNPEGEYRHILPNYSIYNL